MAREGGGEVKILMGDRIEFSNVQLVLFLSNFLEYAVGIAEKKGRLSPGGLIEAKKFVVDEIARRENEDKERSAAEKAFKGGNDEIE